MAPKMGLFLLYIFLSSSLCTAQPNNSSDDIKRWCETTPHPEPCMYFMRHGGRPFAPKRRADFRNLMVQVSRDQTLGALTHTIRLGPRCKNEHQRAAWADCLKLYDNTLDQINRTLTSADTNSSYTTFDQQTWLSTSLTNLETCRLGSVELGVSEFISPILSFNVSELLSNSLAINEGLMEKQHDYEDEYKFPNWVSTGERRLLQTATAAVKANLVVAKDGSGNYRTIQAALDAAAKSSGSGSFIILVKSGVYKENIEVSTSMNNIMLLGDGLRKTIITGSRSVNGGSTTYNSATVAVDGARFMARGITIRNSAGPQNGQAVALRSASDLSVFYRCMIQGYQDTLFVHSQRQFYKECYIYGTIDFIFGNAAVVLQNCVIYARRPLNGQANVITAQGRTDKNQNTGISIHNCRIMAAPDLKPVISTVKTYLGRPWQLYSRTVILRSYLDSLISPSGWTAWGNTNFSQNTLYYGEYKNFGPASATNARVKWGGYHVITSPTVAAPFTVSSFIAGRSWLPATGVPFTSGL